MASPSRLSGVAMAQTETPPGEKDEARAAAQASLVKLQQREHPMCVVCSPHNPSGLKLKFTVRADGSVVAVFDCLPVLQSYPNVLHGGVIATILDSAMLYALFAVEIVAVTTTLEVRYLAPTVPGRFAMVRAWTASNNHHPLYDQRAQLIQDGKVVVEASAKFVVPGVL
jgi:acyl-coenzyme A thioesterase PaaI-like protein